MSKKRVVKDYEALPEEILREVKMKYPTGFADHLVSYTNKEGKKVSALPFDTDEVYYLIRMTVVEAKRIISEDDDYDDEGVLRDDFADDGADEVDPGDDETDDDLPHIIVTRKSDDIDEIPEEPDY